MLFCFGFFIGIPSEFRNSFHASEVLISCSEFAGLDLSDHTLSFFNKNSFYKDLQTHKKTKNKNYLGIMLTLFSFKIAQCFSNHLLNTMLYFRISQKLTQVKMIEVIVLKFMSLKYVILCSKKFITEDIMKIAFLLPCRFSSLRILKLFSANEEDIRTIQGSKPLF